MKVVYLIDIKGEFRITFFMQTAHTVKMRIVKKHIDIKS